jgi:hypothetical protein
MVGPSTSASTSPSPSFVSQPLPGGGRLGSGDPQCAQNTRSAGLRGCRGHAEQAHACRGRGAGLSSMNGQSKWLTRASPIFERK